MTKSKRPVGETDEEGIIEELGAEPANDEEPNGALVADEEKVREAGALDTESIRSNRRNREAINRKNAGVKGVAINEPNVLIKYEEISKMFPVNTMVIMVDRLSGGPPATWTITSQPKTAAELYDAIKALHGKREEATYDLTFRDSYRKEKRGTGRLHMPNTVEEAPHPPGQSPYYPPQASQAQQQQQQQQPPVVQIAQPPSVDPIAMMQSMFQMFQQMQRPQSVVPQQQPPPPTVQVVQPSTDPMAMMQQMFQMFQQMQPPPQPQPSQPVMPPPPPQGSDPSATTAWMQQVFQIFQKMQASAIPQVQPAPPQPPPPPVQAAPPAVDPMEMMQRMFGMFQQMQRTFSSTSGPGQGPGESYRGPGPGGPYRGPYGGPRPPYGGGPDGYPQQQQPPGRPKSTAQEFAEAAAVIDMAVGLAERFRPQQAAASAPPYEREDEDDNPVRVIDAGPAKIVINKDDGSTRLWETGFANMDKILKWMGEQHESIQKASDRREKQQRQQLPPGYVEMTPGYQPPAGYVAVPVDQMPQPPSPEEMPLPIAGQPEEEPVNRTQWGMPPVMPGE